MFKVVDLVPLVWGFLRGRLEGVSLSGVMMVGSEERWERRERKEEDNGERERKGGKEIFT